MIHEHESPPATGATTSPTGARRSQEGGREAETQAENGTNGHGSREDASEPPTQEVTREPGYRRFTHNFDGQGRRVISPLVKLLNNLDLQLLLDFLQSLGVKFTLTTEVTKYRFRLYWWEYDNNGRATVCEYFATGDSPRKAVVSGIAEFLVAYDKDFHDLIDSRMDFREDSASGSRSMRRSRRQDEDGHPHDCQCSYCTLPDAELAKLTGTDRRG